VRPTAYKFRITLRGEPYFADELDTVFTCKACGGAGEVEEWRAIGRIDREERMVECHGRFCDEGVLELIECGNCGHDLTRDAIAAVTREINRGYVYPLCAGCAPEETQSVRKAI
jgi:DnaJ-class molecular chaperone